MVASFPRFFQSYVAVQYFLYPLLSRFWNKQPYPHKIIPISWTNLLSYISNNQRLANSTFPNSSLVINIFKPVASRNASFMLHFNCWCFEKRLNTLDSIFHVQFSLFHQSTGKLHTLVRHASWSLCFIFSKFSTQ